jgi:hypothetical protein
METTANTGAEMRLVAAAAYAITRIGGKPEVILFDNSTPLAFLLNMHRNGLEIKFVVKPKEEQA